MFLAASMRNAFPPNMTIHFLREGGKPPPQKKNKDCLVQLMFLRM
jgi:hypothetical protein